LIGKELVPNRLESISVGVVEEVDVNKRKVITPNGRIDFHALRYYKIKGSDYQK
jgi:hypothetical protein